MLQEITYYMIFGMPFIVYIGIITILLFLITATLALLKRKNKIKISIKWHYILAFISIIFGIIHGILGFISYI